MILKYFQPESDYSWDELDAITAKVEGKWTWPYAGLIWMHEQGFEVRVIEMFDSVRFSKEGESYLFDFFTHEVATAQIANSVIVQELALAKECTEKIATEVRMPSTEAIVALLNDGFLVCCNINVRALNDRDGYVGHFVIVTGCDGDVTLHDPGLPPLENRKVSFDVFEKAWGYPSEKAKNLMAFRINK